MTTMATLSRSLVSSSRLTAQEERDLAERRDAGDPLARNELVERNIPLAIRVANSFARDRPGLLDDLIGASMFGLIEAADRFDPARGVKFGTYASHWIKRAARSWLKDEGSLVRVPRYLHDALSLARRGLPYDATRANPDRLAAARLALTAAGVGAGRDDEISSPCHDPSGGRDRAAEDREWLAAGLARLEGREAAVIRLRFGLGGEGEMTLKQVGARLGVDAETARKDQARGIARLASLLADDVGVPRPPLPPRAPRPGPPLAAEARRLAAEGVPQRQVAARLGVSQSQVSLIVSGKAWPDVA